MPTRLCRKPFSDPPTLPPEMALRDEQADILGGPILQRPDSGIVATFSQYHLVFKSVTLLGLGLLVWIACAHGLEHLRKHRELRYKKAMRRKHGIPDSDCRPFAVAYAAAKRAHLEREAHDQKKATNDVLDHSLPVDQRINAQKDACLRRRVPETAVQHYDYHLSGKHAVAYDNKPPEVHPLDFAERYNPNPRRRVVVPETLPIEWPPVRRTSRKEPVVNLNDNEESRKRSFEDENDVEHEAIKKSRTDVDGLVGGSRRADWYAQYSGRSSPRVRRESLDRQAGSNYVRTNGQEGSERVDGLHNEVHELDEAMEGIDEDEVMELKAVVRGKKRDRTEAGSAFGGDDEEDIQNGRALHHRKRRTILRRVTETPPRGQKRDREVGTLESEGEEVGSETSRRRSQHSPKKKRGKKTASDEVSVADPRVSKDPLCNGRRIGNTWEVDGVQYKVGEKGERLRLTLVKKARNKYHMPQDSQHPDRSVALDIYVEMWLTEEEYKLAEGREELAWQETSRESNGSRTPDVLDSSTKNGKDLLWDSVRYNPARRPFRQPIHPGAWMRINPFEQSQPILSRRVASPSTTVSPILPGVADSPTRLGFRGFSKWEKQDREAEAMARIRAKIEEEKKAQAPPQKSIETPTIVATPEPGTKPPSVPTITLTLAPTILADGKSDNSTPQSKSNISPFPFATPSSTSNPTKETAAAASSTATGFSLSHTSIPAAAPSIAFSNAATATAISTGSLSPFSFGKPPQAPPSTFTATPSSTISSVLGKGFGANMSSSSANLPSTLAAATSPLPADNVPKPVTFAFTKPDISSSTSSPAVTAPAIKFPAPIGNTVSTSSPSPATFGSTPAATKTETPAPPPIPVSAATSESSKSTTPLFSFSASAPSVPKFSFGQPATTSTLAPVSNPAPATASQPKLTFRFGQALTGATGGASEVVDESKRSGIPVTAFGTVVGSNELTKPPPSGMTSAFGNPNSPHSVSLFGNPVAVDNNPSTSKLPKPTLAHPSATTFGSAVPSTPTGAPASGSIPVFSFGGTSSGSKSVEVSKPVALSGGAAGGSNPLFGGNPTGGKPTFTLNAPADGFKPNPPSAFGSSTEGSIPMFAFGDSAEPKSTSVPDSAVEGSKSTFATNGAAETRLTSGPATENAKPSNLTDPSKSPNPGSTRFALFPSTSSFTFGKKDDMTTNTPTSTSTQMKPTASFTFAAPSSAIFGQPSSFGTSGDSSRSIFGKPTDATPNAFGFAGTGGSTSSSTFTFGKPTAQNQKQEQ